MSFARSAYVNVRDNDISSHAVDASTSGRIYEQQAVDDNLMASTLTNFLQSDAIDVANPVETDPRVLSYQLHTAVSPVESNPHALPYHLQAAAVAATTTTTTANHGIHTEDYSNLGDPELKQRRLGRACDACSKRKVKCDDQVPCKHCVDLGTPCTFSRPTKRRGPANRMADELKKQRLVSDVLIPGDAQDLANPDTYLSLVAISSFQSIQRMVYDFYTYVYPIFPFPHEHLTLRRLRKREDIHNKSFSGLIASMVAALVTVFPKAAEKALLSDSNGEVFLEHLLARCMLVCEQARGPLTGERDVNEAAASFFVALVHHLRKQTAQVSLYLAESLSIVHYLDVEIDSPSKDHVTRELCKRIYWAVYGLSRSLIQIGNIQEMMPPRRVSRLPPLALELDDYYIFDHELKSRPHDQLSLIESTNYIARIYASYHGLLKFEFLEVEDQMDAATKIQEAAIVKDALQTIDSAAASLHPELRSDPDPRLIEAEEEGEFDSPMWRARQRHEVQKIILRSTIIKTRYYLNERLSHLIEHAYDHEQLVLETWDTIVNDLLALLVCVSYKSLAPLGRLVSDDLKRVHKGLEESKVVDIDDPIMLNIRDELHKSFGEDVNS